MTSSTDSARAGFIKRFWRGEVRLVIAFWVFDIAVPLALKVFAHAAFWRPGGNGRDAVGRRPRGTCLSLVGVDVSGGGLGRHPRSAKCYIFAQTSGLKKALGYAAMIQGILVLVRFGAVALLLIFVGGELL